MASKELLAKLNEALSNEVLASIQYMWHHITVRGINAESLGGVFKNISMAEMKHAEAIAERIDYLGGLPTTMPLKKAICLGKTPHQMLKVDKEAEEEAIALYKEIIRLAEKEEDHTTRRLFEKILSDEEKHHHTFVTLLEK
ncbi:MAG: ferritin-like domain-containing protein [Nitrospirota bacterium]